MVKDYTPERGDVVWITFGKTKGHEQRGRRPALVLSVSSYQIASELAVVCPITSNIKPYPFVVEIHGKKIHGAILTDQVQSVAWRERRTEYIEKAGVPVLLDVVKHIVKLVGIKSF